MARRGWSRHGPSAADRRRHRWGRVLHQVWDDISDHHLLLLAAAIAFYGFLALFPGLIALVSLYGLVADPAQVEAIIASVGGTLPEAAETLLAEQLRNFVSHSSSTLSYALAFSVGLGLYSGASGIKTLMEAINIAYEAPELRGFVRFNLVALGLTMGALVLMIVAITGVVIVPAVAAFLTAHGLPQQVGTLLSLSRWVILTATILFALAVLDHFCPPRPRPRWRWITPGAILTTVLWLLGSAGFSAYVSAFGSYDKMYGSLAAVVILLIWLDLTAFLVILGAQLNAALERHALLDRSLPEAGRPQRKERWWRSAWWANRRW